MNEQNIRSIIREVLADNTFSPKAGALAPAALPQSACMSGGAIPLEISARHVHLTRQAVEQLFGAGATLTRKRGLSQPGEFLSEQRVRLITPQGVLENIAVLGPERGTTQVELAASDCRRLGISARVNLSGDLTGAGDITIAGDRGCVFAPASVIVARAHIHMQPKDALAFGLKDGEHVGIRIQSLRPVTLSDVVVRVHEKYALACHIDVDEANAALADCNAKAFLAGCEPHPSPVLPKPDTVADCPYFDGTLITEAIAVSVRKQGGCIRIRKGTIITPAAQDVFNGMQMKIEIM